jgi:DNA replication protein DnaC
MDRSTPAEGATRCEFDLCDGSGFIVDETAKTARDCRCRPLRIARARAGALEGRIPAKFRAVSFETTEVIDMERRFRTQVREIRSFVGEIGPNLDAGRGLWLSGDVGTGKTTLAMIVSKAAIDAGRSVAIYSCPRLLGVLRESIDAGGVLAFLDRLAEADLLHIDDLGAEHRTEWVLEQLYSIVNARYQDERSIVVTSNFDRDELAEQLGERTVSRLEACCELLPFYGPDARRVSYPLAG